MKIHWLSRHDPLPAQRRALKELFPDSVVIQHEQKMWMDAAEIQRSVNGDELLVIAPLTLIGKLLDLGMRPLWSVMELTTADYAKAHKDECISAPRDRWLRFVKFKRLVGIEMKFEELVGAGR